MSSAAGSTPPATAAGTPQPCSSSDDGIPSGATTATTATTIDVDGDLEADQQWVTEDGAFGVTTTSGLTSSVRPTGLAGGAEPSRLR